eukprot:TRINITY_DN7563_c0_g1_i2.p1 TRINITY_DN7563_c0_g1~~TRINITY_DN7563_c0_g1_i2.p1  ORF type:complete len:346 (+),score=95.06 TRINITY_DN7563_c0_g1_i2:32-1069(+)
MDELTAKPAQETIQAYPSVIENTSEEPIPVPVASGGTQLVQQFGATAPEVPLSDATWDAVDNIWRYCDPETGLEYIYNTTLQIWEDEEFVLQMQQQASIYGQQPTPNIDTDTVSDATPSDAPPANGDPQTTSSNETGRGVKRKRELKTKGKNLSVYISGLPNDITMNELVDVASRAGVLRKDDNRVPKATIYVDENGVPKGDALVTYFKEDSLPLAFQILDGYPLRGIHKLSVEMAKFEKKPGKTGKRRKQRSKRRYNQEEELNWEEKEEKNVILKHMFDPKSAYGDIDYYVKLQEEIEMEVVKIGPIDKVKVFERNPEGVVAVKFKDAFHASRCIQVCSLHAQY